MSYIPVSTTFECSLQTKRERERGGGNTHGPVECLFPSSALLDPFAMDFLASPSAAHPLYEHALDMLTGFIIPWDKLDS